MHELQHLAASFQHPYIQAIKTLVIETRIPALWGELVLVLFRMLATADSLWINTHRRAASSHFLCISKLRKALVVKHEFLLVGLGMVCSGVVGFS